MMEERKDDKRKDKKISSQSDPLWLYIIFLFIGIGTIHMLLTFGIRHIDNLFGQLFFIAFFCGAIFSILCAIYKFLGKEKLLSKENWSKNPLAPFFNALLVAFYGSVGIALLLKGNLTYILLVIGIWWGIIILLNRVSKSLAERKKEGWNKENSSK